MAYPSRSPVTYGAIIGLTMMLALACTHSPDTETQEAEPVSSSEHQTRIVLLGTGTPNAEPERAGPATAIICDDRSYLIDMGPGIVRRASAAYQNGVRALAPSRLDRVFVTHLHSDHTVGLSDLLLTPWVLGRNTPLAIYGPPGIRSMAEHIHAAYADDIKVRTEGREHANPTGHQVQVEEITEGIVYRDDQMTVSAFSVSHGSWEHAFGYRFDGPDRSIVISGDTAPDDNLVRHAKGCDVLVHEVYCDAAFSQQPAQWQHYHSAFHTSAVELGELAARVQPGLLVLYHQLAWGCPEEMLLEEIGRSWNGPVAYGNDLDVF